MAQDVLDRQQIYAVLGEGSADGVPELVGGVSHALQLRIRYVLIHSPFDAACGESGALAP